MEQSRQVDRSEKLSSQVRVFDMRFLNSCCGCCVLLFCIHSAFPTLDGSSSSILTSVGEGGGGEDIVGVRYYEIRSDFGLQRPVLFPCPSLSRHPEGSMASPVTDRPADRPTDLPGRSRQITPRCLRRRMTDRPRRAPTRLGTAVPPVPPISLLVASVSV